MPNRILFPANVSSYVRSSCEEAANLAEESAVKAPITSLITRSEKLEAIPEGIEKVRTESAYFCANGSFLRIILTLKPYIVYSYRRLYLLSVSVTTRNRA